MNQSYSIVLFTTNASHTIVRFHHFTDFTLTIAWLLYSWKGIYFYHNQNVLLKYSQLTIYYIHKSSYEIYYVTYCVKASSKRCRFMYEDKCTKLSEQEIYDEIQIKLCNIHIYEVVL